MRVSQKLQSSSELHAADLFADVPTSQFESEDEEATRMYIAPSAVQLSSSFLTSIKPSTPLSADSAASISGWDASTIASSVGGVQVSPKPAFRAPAKSSKSKALFAAVMGVAVLMTGGGAMYAATRVGGTDMARRAAPTTPRSSVAAAPAMLPPAAVVRPAAPVVEQAAPVAQPEIASVETLFAAMHADKAAKAAEVAAPATKGGAKHAVVAQAARPVKSSAPTKVAATSKVAPTPVARVHVAVKVVAPKSVRPVRPVKPSELDDAL